ncbi:hypothetical protein H9L39_14717 [Fusarium oxysporum f. sp. albedinis]|nr:hypothetical protein H9L39_14717 [Fusarium oxysporum f. sp. albedinis]
MGIELMPFQLILSLEPAQCCEEQLWRLVQGSCRHERMLLNRLTIVILKHTTFPTATGTHNNIAKSYIVLCVGGAAADTDHQSETNVWKAAQHVPCHSGGGGRAILRFRQDGHDNVVLPDFPQSIVIIVIIGDCFELVVFFVKEGSRSDKLGGDGTNPADRVLLGIRHGRRSMSSEEEDVLYGLTFATELPRRRIEVRMLLVAAGMYRALRIGKDFISWAHGAYVQQLAAGWALLSHDWRRNPCQSNRLPKADGRRRRKPIGGWCRSPCLRRNTRLP